MQALTSIDARVLSALIAAVVSAAISLPGAILLILRYRNETSLSRRTEIALRTLLKQPKVPFVAFKVIRHFIGGYTDDELRQLLVRAGALRFADNNMVEYWALLSSLSCNDRQALSPILIMPNLSPPPDHKLFPAKPKESRDGTKS
jgi:hypothetical protein